MGKNKESRRKLLKSIAAGSGAVVAGKALPEEWSKPVVDSVMLPAHAATTTDESQSESLTDTTRNTCASLYIPGISNLVCSTDESSKSASTYWIDDTGECPILKTGSPTSPADEIVVSWTHVLNAFVRIAVSLEGAQDDKSIAQVCLIDDPNPAKSYDHQIGFKAKSGALWLASFTMTRTVDTRSVSLSNIALSPL